MRLVLLAYFTIAFAVVVAVEGPEVSASRTHKTHPVTTNSDECHVLRKELSEMRHSIDAIQYSLEADRTKDWKEWAKDVTGMKDRTHDVTGRDGTKENWKEWAKDVTGMKDGTKDVTGKDGTWKEWAKDVTGMKDGTRNLDNIPRRLIDIQSMLESNNNLLKDIKRQQDVLMDRLHQQPTSGRLDQLSRGINEAVSNVYNQGKETVSSVTEGVTGRVKDSVTGRVKDNLPNSITDSHGQSWMSWLHDTITSYYRSIIPASLLSFFVYTTMTLLLLGTLFLLPFLVMGGLSYYRRRQSEQVQPLAPPVDIHKQSQAGQRDVSQAGQREIAMKKPLKPSTME